MRFGIARASILAAFTSVLLGAVTPAPAQQPATHDKPNILVIFGDDVGQTNISAYSHG